MELPFVSSIEVRASHVLDQEGINGTVLPDDDPAIAPHKRSPEILNVSNNEEKTNRRDLYPFITPNNVLQIEMDNYPLMEEQKFPLPQIPGKISKIKIYG